jgi:8-oxo-dGTP pyrophosphatase MutT (NUDIX family)
MLYLIPAPAHRIVLRLAHATRRRWWRLRRPSIAGCRVLALDPDGRVLLVRHSYGSGKWMPPGGGLARGEDALAAARRELLEETGCSLEWALLVELAEEDLHGAGNAVHVIAGLTRDTPLADGREIIEAAFFAAHALPDNMPAMFRARLPGWLTAATAARPEDAALPPFPPPAPTG